MADELDHVEHLERELLTSAVRADRARLEEPHPDFVETGASGRRWARCDIIDALVASPDPGDIEIDGLVAHLVGDGAVLVTYSTRRNAAVAHRAALWLRHGGGWAVRHHQRTADASGAVGSRPGRRRR